MSGVARRAFLKILGMAPVGAAVAAKELSAEAVKTGTEMGIFESMGGLIVLSKPPADWTIQKMFQPANETIYQELLRFLREEEQLLGRKKHMFDDVEPLRSMSPAVKRVCREQRQKEYDRQLAYIENTYDKFHSKFVNNSGPAPTTMPSPSCYPRGYSR